MSNNNSITISKQDNGRPVVIMNRTKYLDKIYPILGSNYLTKLDPDLTCYSEDKVQRTLKKKKFAMPENLYSKLYP